MANKNGICSALPFFFFYNFKKNNIHVQTLVLSSTFAKFVYPGYVPKYFAFFVHNITNARDGTEDDAFSLGGGRRRVRQEKRRRARTEE